MLKWCQLLGVILLKLSLIPLVAILLSGCSSKRVEFLTKQYSQNLDYHKALQHTQKVNLYKDGLVHASLTATYLPNKDNEEFIVGLTLNDGSSEELDSEVYDLLLSGENSLPSVEKIELNDERLKNISFVTNWSSYYLFKFSKTSKQKLKLIFKSSKYGEGELNFAKKAKFTFENHQVQAMSFIAPPQ